MPEKALSIDQFRKEYIWGFTQGNPIKQSGDKKAFLKLIALLSNTTTITICSSFHPYHLLDGKGGDLWEVLFNSLLDSANIDMQKLIDENLVYHVDPPPANSFPIVKWEDERLFIERNPEFGKFVPFVVPFLRYDDGQDPLWLNKIQKELKEKYNAHNFIDKVNEASRFFLPEPTFILGFDEFDKENPSLLVEHYVTFLKNVIKQ